METAIQQKLKILADAAKFDASCASSGSRRPTPIGGIGNAEGMGICHSYTPDGRCVSLLKILLTNICIFDCSYCINRVSSNVQRARFTVDEVVWLTMEFYRRNYIEGLFLSSGVAQTSDTTMEEMIEIARRLREVEKFGGYIHLKAIAGASAPLLARAGRYADRLSANIELPTQADLDELAPAKTHAIIEDSMSSIGAGIDEAKLAQKESKMAPVFAPAGQSTQMIIGATPSDDRSVLLTASSLYKKYNLRRVYYSAFSPIPSPSARLPTTAPPLVREHRLYQADWLLRHYGFKVNEIVPEGAADLDLFKDPKLAWALRNLSDFPVDINRAPKAKILRIPGVGAAAADKIIKLRQVRAVRLSDLPKLRVSVEKCKYFVSTADHNPAARELDKLNFDSIFKPSKSTQKFLVRSGGDTETVKQKNIFDFGANWEDAVS